MANNCGTQTLSRNSSVFFHKMTLYLGYVEKYENFNVKFTPEQPLLAQGGVEV
jgi:hypothetical protein